MAVEGTAHDSQARKGWATVVAAMIGLMFSPSTIAIMGIGVFIGPLQQEFGWSRTAITFASLVVTYTVVVVSPLQGMLIDRFGVRRVVLLSIPLFAAGLGLLYFLPDNVVVFYAAWAGISVVSMGLLPVAYLRAVSSWFERRLGLAIGMANSGIGIGNMFVPLIAAFLIANYGWREAYVGFGVIVLVITLPIAFLALREATEPRRHAQATTSVPGNTFREASRNANFWYLAAAFFLLGVVNMALITQQVPLLIDAGLTPARAAVVQSVFGVFLVIGRIGTGFVLDYVFAPLVMIAVCLGAILAVLIYATGAAGDIVFLCSALIGLVVGAEFDVLTYVTKRYFGMRAFGKIYATIFSIFNLGGGLGAVAFAFSRDQFGSYAHGLVSLAIILVACALLFSRLTRYGDVAPARQAAATV